MTVYQLIPIIGAFILGGLLLRLAIETQNSIKENHK